MGKEIIWRDNITGQKFIIDDDTGERIFILENGSRVWESDLILEELLEELDEEERIKGEEETAKLMAEEEERRRQEEEAEMEEEEEEAIYWYYYGPGSDDWNEE